MNQAYSRLSTTHGHITDCKLDSVVYAGVSVVILPRLSDRKRCCSGKYHTDTYALGSWYGTGKCGNHVIQKLHHHFLVEIICPCQGEILVPTSSGCLCHVSHDHDQDHVTLMVALT